MNTDRPQNKNLKPFTKGYDSRRNYKGGPIGSGFGNKRMQLIKLIKAIAASQSQLTDREINIAYQIYEIAKLDLSFNSVSSSINHLYFIESKIGIKIGISKNVQNRLEQIKIYASDARILKVINFAGKFEKSIHRKFRLFNIRNNKDIGIEWFTKHDDIYAFIESVDTVDCMHKYFEPKGIGQLKLF